jgi:hypothetical protein
MSAPPVDQFRVDDRTSGTVLNNDRIRQNAGGTRYLCEGGAFPPELATIRHNAGGTRYRCEASRACYWKLEGLIVACSDEIAQRHHDIEDGLVAKIIDIDELLSFFSDCFKGFLSFEEEQALDRLTTNHANRIYFIPEFGKLLVNFYVSKLIDNTRANLNKLMSDYGTDGFHRNKALIKTEHNIGEIANFDIDFCERDKALVPLRGGCFSPELGTVARLAELAKSILWCMLTGITIAVVIQWLNQYIETHKKINKIMIVCFLLFGLDLLLFNFFMPLVFNADIPDLIIRTIVDILAVASGYIVAYRTQQQS